MNKHSIFYPGNENLNLIVVTILVMRLGGRVKITQSDIDNIAYNKLLEEGVPDGIEFTFMERGRQ